MSGTHWTPEQLSELTRLYPTNSPEAVAAAIGRPLRSVYNKASVLGIKSLAPREPRPKPVPTLASRPCLPVAKPAKATVRGPGYLIGEPIFTDKTRYVVGPSPQRALRTNTFSE